MAEFDPDAAQLLLRRRWLAALYGACLAPFEEMVSELDARFRAVPLDGRRPPKNRVPMFRFRVKANEARYAEHMERHRACADALAGAIENVMKYVAAVHAGSHGELKARLFATMDRWDALKPGNLRGRTDEGVLDYTACYRRLSEACLLDMFWREEELHDRVVAKHRSEGVVVVE